MRARVTSKRIHSVGWCGSGGCRGIGCRACSRAGQDLRSQAVALGAALASPAEGAGGVGRLGARRPPAAPSTFKVFPAQQLGKAFDHYDMARDGIADVTYINPGYQPGRFPIIGAGELPFLMSNAKGGSQALDAWYRKYADAEMKDVKFCLAFVHDSGLVPLQGQEDHGAGRHQGHEDPARARHHGVVRHLARRHQRAVERA